MPLRKPPFWASSLTVCGVAVLGTLGTWQLQRLQWKEDLVARINSYKDSEIRTLSVNDLTADNEFMKGRLIGHFDYSREIAIKPRTYDGTPGVHIITPFILENNSTILINRGWGPNDYTVGKSEEAASSVNVIIRVPQKPNMFVPPNLPDQNEWYALNIEQIGQTKGLQAILPVTGYQLDEKVRETEPPYAHALEIRLNNNHLQYALFWYTMAVIMIGVFVLRFLKPVKS